MNKLLILLTLVLFSSCSYTLNVIQTEGNASDVLDANQSLDAKADVDATIPVKLTP